MKTPRKPSAPASGEPSALPPLNPKEFETVVLPLSKIKRYHNNPRQNEKAVQSVVASLQEFGFRKPLVLDHSRTIIAGDTTYVAAEVLGYPAAPCWIVPEGRLSAEQIRGYRIADNRTAEESSWDTGRLGVELTELLEANYDLAQTGFNRAELDRYLTQNDDSGLEPVQIRPAPKFAWVLIGIDVTRYIEISDAIEKISALPDIFCEVAANNSDPAEPIER